MPCLYTKKRIDNRITEVIINILDVNKIVNFIIGRHRRE